MGSDGEKFILNVELEELKFKMTTLLYEIEQKFRKRLKLKPKNNFDNTPVLRTEILEFFRKCYTGEYMGVIKLINNGESLKDDSCNVCGTGLDDDLYCVICEDFMNPSNKYNVESVMGREDIFGKLIGETGKGFENYDISRVIVVTPIQEKVARFINERLYKGTTDSVETDNLPRFESKKQAADWVKNKYAKLLKLSPREVRLQFIEELEPKPNITYATLNKQLDNIVGTTIEDVSKFVISTDSQPFYIKLVQKLKENEIIETNFLSPVYRAVIEWVVSFENKDAILSKYNLTGKKIEFDTVKNLLVELGILTQSRHGMNPTINPDF